MVGTVGGGGLLAVVKILSNFSCLGTSWRHHSSRTNELSTRVRKPPEASPVHARSMAQLARTLATLLEQNDRIGALSLLKSDAPTLKLGQRQRLVNDCSKAQRERGHVDVEALARSLADLMGGVDNQTLDASASGLISSSIPAVPVPVVELAPDALGAAKNGAAVDISGAAAPGNTPTGGKTPDSLADPAGSTPASSASAVAPTPPGSIQAPAVAGAASPRASFELHKGLACFVACHAAVPSRASDLQRALDSLWAQAPKLPQVHVSWSASAEAAPHVRALLRGYEARGLPLEHIEHKGRRLAQFEHLQALTKRARASRTPPRWVAFADDDDVSSETRFALLAAECRRADDAGRDGPSVLQCLRKARPAVRLRGQPKDADAVRVLLANGGARLADARLSAPEPRSAKQPTGGFHAVEYFDMVVKLEVLRGFFAKATPSVISHQFADLAFVFLAREGTWGPIISFSPPDPSSENEEVRATHAYHACVPRVRVRATHACHVCVPCVRATRACHACVPHPTPSACTAPPPRPPSHLSATLTPRASLPYTSLPRVSLPHIRVVPPRRHRRPRPRAPTPGAHALAVGLCLLLRPLPRRDRVRRSGALQRCRLSGTASHSPRASAGRRDGGGRPADGGV